MFIQFPRQFVFISVTARRILECIALTAMISRQFLSTNVTAMRVLVFIAMTAMIAMIAIISMIVMMAVIAMMMIVAITECYRTLEIGGVTQDYEITLTALQN